jgi:rhomboid protease GluP
MNQPATDPLEAILYQCAQAAPRPWYPRQYAESIGIQRDTLDPFLERLRLSGLISLTPWEKDLGQGYTLTAEGKRVLYNPHLLARLRDGTLPVAPPREETQANLRDAPSSTYGRGELVREAMVSRAPPVMTYTLIGINILVFLAGLGLALSRKVPAQDYLLATPHAYPIIHAIGSVSIVDLVLLGQWWRLLSSCFVHIGVLHLAVNMYALNNVGPLLERMFGRWRYLLLYLVAGWGGSCIGVLLQIGGAGASGAICGLLGALAAWTFLNRRFLPPPVFASIKRYLVINSFLIAAISLMGYQYISWSGHLGGAVFGLVAGGLLTFQRFGSRRTGSVALLGVLVLPLVGVGPLLYIARTDPRLQRFHEAVDQQRAEIERLNDKVLEPVQTLRDEALEAYDEQAKPLLGQHWQRRDPAAVDKALAALAQGQGKLRQGLEIVEKNGPFTSPVGVKVSRACQELLEANLQRFELAERCLREGGQWTEKDEQALRKQTERADRALEKFKAALDQG